MVKSIGQYTVSGRLKKNELEKFENLFLKKKMACKNKTEEHYCIKSNIVREALLKYMEDEEKAAPEKREEGFEEMVRNLFNRIERKTIKQT